MRSLNEADQHAVGGGHATGQEDRPPPAPSAPGGADGVRIETLDHATDDTLHCGTYTLDAKRR